MAGKHKKRQSLDLHSLSMQAQQQHPLHSHMCKPIDAPSSFKVLLVRSIVVNPRNERLETQNTKRFKKHGDKKVYSNLSIIINNKNNTRISKTLISEKTLFINKNAKAQRESRKHQSLGGGKKGAGKKKKKDARKNCKRRRSLELTYLCFESKFHNNNTHCIHSQKCTSRHLMIVFPSTSL